MDKKQLIIVPPMSEALKKLNDVLEGISADENIEISLIDDLKELGQVLANTGQSLVLCANAKKCATFLQENRFIISRFHTKVMLFTPKEIPVKTLAKFTKIGLTESILENAPPKTLLYKIKLQLRSIKSSTPQSEVEKEKEVVKSMIDLNSEAKAIAEEETIVEKNTTENIQTPEVEEKKKIETTDENILDYGSNLKGKIKPQEEAIETHWKSKRKVAETSLDLSPDSESSTPQARIEEDFDQYYRGKSKKKSEVFEEIDDYTKLKKIAQQDAVENSDEKKKSGYVETIENEYMRQKKLAQESAYDSELKMKPNSPEISLDIEKAENRTKEQLAYDPNEKTKKAPGVQNLEFEKENRKEKLEQAQDLGGHYKGKISAVDLEMESALKKEKEDKDYDNSGLDGPRKENIELDLYTEKKKNKGSSETQEENKTPHEAQVDHLGEEKMEGDGATDHIETYMGGKTTTHKKSRDDQTEDDSDSDSDLKNKIDEQEKKNSAQRMNTSAPEVAQQKKKEKIDYESNDSELEFKKSADGHVEFENEVSQKNEDLPQSTADSRKESDGLDITDGELEVRDPSQKDHYDNAQDIKLKKLDTTELDLEKNRKKAGDSTVEQIDTYYRSGEAKKPQHSWDNLVEKKHETQLALLKSKKADTEINTRHASKDAGEITIDYRKLKQEFDLISRGMNAEERGAFSHRENTRAEQEEESSFKVREPSAHGLDLSVAVVNAIYDKTTRPKAIYALVAEELLLQYGGHAVFYSYKTFENKYLEVYNTYMELPEQKVSAAKKEWWIEFKKLSDLFAHYQSKSMTTWRCPEIVENEIPWEDIELPSWAKQELKDKKVELIFPYFDGLDKMGLALVFFPEGINHEQEPNILTSLELVRALLLDEIQRHQIRSTPNRSTEEPKDEAQTNEAEKKNILQFIGGIFGRKKVG